MRRQFYGRRRGRRLRGARAAALITAKRYEISLFDPSPDGRGKAPFRQKWEGEGNQENPPSSATLSARRPRIKSGAGSLPSGRGEDHNNKIDVTALFSVSVQETWLEIGFGNGEHLLAQAAAHPAIGFIGCEPFLNGISALALDIETLGLANIRIYPDDARLLLKALPAASIARCFILFADPWPKSRHAKRRIVNTDTLADLAWVLKPGGELRLATDDEGLAAWYMSLFQDHPTFILAAASGADPQTRPTGWPATRYEEKAVSRGKKPYYFSVLLNCAVV